MPDVLPDRADTVVIGGGIIGLATAYHLCARGCNDVVVLERCQIASGTTWHAAGLVGSVRPSENFHRLIDKIYDFIRAVEEESGLQTGYREVGSLWIADDEERWAEIRRLHDQTKVWGPETRLVTPDELRSLHALINTQGLLGGMFAPQEGWISPVDFSQAVARAITKRGGRIIENAPVEAIHTSGGKIEGVEVNGHQIQTNVVANCAGLWGQHIGRMVGADVPLQAVEHYYAVTAKSEEIPRDLPVLRDQNACAYIKEDAGSLLIGAFEREARPIELESLPNDFAFGELAGDSDGQFLPVLAATCHRLPIVETLEIRKFFCGPESFTPDGRVQIGKSDAVDGFFVCCGCNSQGIQSSAGLGSALADWIVDDIAPCDLSDFDVRRNEPFTNTKSYVWQRSVETLGLLYDHHFPYRQLATARGVRRSPLHSLLAERGACFGEVAGWERANWFAPTGVEPKYEYSFARPNWLDYSADEHRAMRTGVGLIDLSSFATFLVTGPQALEALQQTCSANVDVAVGRTVYTHWLNAQAGIEADLTVIRLAEDRFQVTTGVGVRRRDWDWLQRQVQEFPGAHTVDTSSGTAIIGVFGEKSRALLESVAKCDLSDDACPFAHSVDLEIGASPVRAVRVSFAGGLGWELHVGTEFAAYTFERLEAAGAEHGVKLCGMHALDSCRIERGFVHFGHEVSQDETPFHVSLGFVCDFKKPAFSGRDAALRIKEAGKDQLRKRLISVRLEDPDRMLYGHEPVLRQGEPVGYVTSGAYGHSLGAAAGLAWLRQADGVSQDWIEAGSYEILIENQPASARVSLQPFIDRSGTPRPA